MGALLDRQCAVGERRFDHERRRLDPGFLGVGDVVDLGWVAVPLSPPQVHPHEHLGPIGGVHSAGLGADGHQGIPLVVLAGQQRPDLQ
jgi:hypothetical protein